MKKLKLKSESELLLLVQNKNDLYDYIDNIHNKLLDYQLIIDTISHAIEDNIKKIELNKDHKS